MSRRIILVLIFAVVAHGSQIDFPFNGLKGFIKVAKRTVCAIYLKDKNGIESPIGTGFVTSKGGVALVVTCFHAVQDVAKARGEITIGLNMGNGFKKFQCTFVAADPSNDIAILSPVSKEIKGPQLMNIIVDDGAFSADSLVQEGASILVPGYPLGLGVEFDKNNPINKMGFIAQKANDSIYVADFTANPGNSGSPVFDIPNQKLIGMVLSYTADRISLFDKQGNLVANMPYNSGLANIVSAKYIKRLLDKVVIK